MKPLYPLAPGRSVPPVEVLDNADVARLQAMTPAQRVAAAMGLHTFARGVVTCRVRREHPDWGADQVAAAAMRIMLHEPD